jgi:hypothetical protein
MFEAIIAALIIAALLLAAWVPALPLLWAGAAIGTLGAVVGVPAGLVYHARLWRALRAEGQTTAGMLLRPHHLHDKLSAERLRVVQIWFAVGVVGFVMTIAGALAVVVALVRLLPS